MTAVKIFARLSKLYRSGRNIASFLGYRRFKHILRNRSSLVHVPAAQLYSTRFDLFNKSIKCTQANFQVVTSCINAIRQFIYILPH